MTQSPAVLYVSVHAPVDQGTRLYRCTNQAKQLLRAGWSARVLHYEEARKADIDAADIVVFSRVRSNDKAMDLIQLGRRANKLLCADLDDRVFTPWDVDTTGYLRSRARPRSSVSGRQAREQREVLQLLPAYEMVTVSTPGIREELELLGVPAQVTPNAYDEERFPLIERERTRLGRILIMSGTPTHDEDLRRIAPALARFLAEHRDVQCTLLGSLSVASPLLGLPNVKTQALLPVAKLYEFVAQHDLCLVPLEDTLYNDCKSALKFLECGAV
jgi:glycosyltransferase involved in cell wall biosynthesis